MKIDVLRQGGHQQGGIDQTGGTLTGPLILSRNPQLPLEAATKQYIDQSLQTLSASNFTTGTLPISRLPALSGDVTSEPGSNNISLAPSGITAGQYGKIVVDSKGRATNGTILAPSDIPNINFNKISTDKPTTLGGYGITDGVPVSGATMTGALNLSGNPTAGEHLIPKQYIDSMVSNLSSAKTGDVIRKAYSATPVGFLKCNGAAVDKTTYSNLYAIIGDTNTNYSLIGSGQPWRQQYDINTDQLSDMNVGWTTGTVIPNSLGWTAAFVTKNRVYLCGGWNGTSCASSVYTAQINPDGTLGAWSTGTSLPIAVSHAKAIITKNRVYLIGGATANNVSTANIYTAPINIDGTIGAWSLQGTLPVALTHASVIATKAYVFVIGGENNTTQSPNVYYSPIAVDGTIGSWTTGTALPGNLNGSQAIVTKNRVYLLGGHDGSNWLATVYTAPINSDGTLGTWTTGTSLPVPAGYGSTVVTRNRVYYFGGYLNNAYSTSIYTAPVNADGTLGTWTTTGSLPSALTITSPIVTNSRIYLLGGYSGSAYSNTVLVGNFSGGANDYSTYYEDFKTNYMMPGSGRPWEQQYQINLNQSGDITGWTAGPALPSILFSHQIIVTKNRVYILYGSNYSVLQSAIYTAVINADGTLGAWTATTSFPVAISNTTLFVTKNRVYVCGGNTASGGVSTVYTAPINADGTLGTWTTSGSLPGAVWAGPGIVTKNRAYVIAGYGTNAVYTAPINNDGTLGTWTTSTAFPAALHLMSIAVTNNRIFAIGGATTTTTAQSTVYSATINSDGVIGAWTADASFPVNIYNAYTFVSENMIYIIGGSTTNSSSTVSTIYTSRINPDGTLSVWTTTANIPISICNFVGAAIKNKLYIFGGYTGTAAVSNVYYATIADGLSDYSPYYDGTITPFEPVNKSTTFKLPDMSETDVNGIYHYIKY